MSNDINKVSPNPRLIFLMTFLILVIAEIALVTKLVIAKVLSIPLIGAIGVVAILILVLVAPQSFRRIQFGNLLIELQHRTQEIQDKVANLVLLSMSDEVYTQLKHIANETMPSATMGASFRRELGYLDVLGYVKFPHGGLSSLRDGETYNMTMIAKVTDLGRAFIDLREEAKKRVSQVSLAGK